MDDDLIFFSMGVYFQHAHAFTNLMIERQLRVGGQRGWQKAREWDRDFEMMMNEPKGRALVSMYTLTWTASLTLFTSG
jgi:hypothetical protein